MDIVIAALAVVVAFPVGMWAGIRMTARNVDRLLAVMADEDVVAVARKARARKALIDATHGSERASA